MNWFWRKRDREIEEELIYHRAMLGEEMGEDAARRRMGNQTQIAETTREVWVWTWLDTLVLDIRFAARQLRKRPTLVAVAGLSLSLGIGANTAIFTVINAILLQSLPVRDPGRLVLFYDGIQTGVYSGDEPRGDYFSYPFWQSIQGKVEAFNGLCAFRQSIDRAALYMAGSRETGAPEQATFHLVSGNYFDVLGVPPALGRMLQLGDERLNAAPVAVISHDYWRNRFASDPTIIGKTALLNGTAFTIVGVSAREFFGERVQSPPNFFVPLSWQPQMLLNESWLEARNVDWLNMMGRLKPGVSREQAQKEADARLHEFFRGEFGEHPPAEKAREIAAAHVHLKPGGSGISGLRFLYSEPLHMLMGAVALVLLIASANVAVLFMARATARTQEFLARIALGASRSRVIRQVLAETVLLSAISGVAGIAVAWDGVKGLVALMRIQPVVKIKPDLVVLAFTAVLAGVTGILFGVIPAVRCSRMEPRAAAAVRTMEFGTGRFGATRTLIAAQVAISLALLFGAALLAHSLAGLQTEYLGFQRDHILIVRTDPRIAGYKGEQLLGLYQQLDRTMNAIPGVVSASLARYTPEDGSTSTDNFSIAGRVPKSGEPWTLNDLEVGPRFFETLHIPVLRGRGIRETDLPNTPDVVVVNETLAKEFFPNRNPIGQRISLGAPFGPPGYEIVGVAGDTRYFDVRKKPEPIAFFSAWQGKAVSRYSGALLFDVAGDPHNVLAAVRKALQGIDSRLTIQQVWTLDEEIKHSYRQQTLVTELCSLFGVLALLLAAVGMYGSGAYLVTRRTAEMGIRMTLGARRGDVLWTVLSETLLVAGLGLLAGVPCALVASRLVQRFLFEVTTFDPISVGVALLVIACAALIAGYLPARRATRIDPMRALRHE